MRTYFERRSSPPGWLVVDDYDQELLGSIKSGKEGSVSLVRRWSAQASCLLALKTHKKRERRSFKREEVYRAGRHVPDRRTQRAMARKSRFGAAAGASDWVGTEYEVLGVLWRAGASVPYPVAHPVPCLKHPVHGCPDWPPCPELGNSLMMQFIGDEYVAAPRLIDLRPDRDLAAHLYGQVVEQIEIFVDCGIVHGDLSAYNVLCWDDTAWVIDFPQAVAVKDNPVAPTLLHRDLHNVCSYFERFGVSSDPETEFSRLYGQRHW